MWKKIQCEYQYADFKQLPRVQTSSSSLVCRLQAAPSCADFKQLPRTCADFKQLPRRREI